MNRILPAIVLVAAACAQAAPPLPSPTPVRLLMLNEPARVLSPEADMARELAQRVSKADLIFQAATGDLVDREGRRVVQDGLRVIWCHHGEPIAQGDAPRHAAASKSLRAFVENGGALLLTGSAAALVEPLGLDTVRIRSTAENDRGQAGLIPFAADHPALKDLDLDRGVCWISNAAFPAFAEFHPTSNPAKGEVLAKTPGGPEIPLIEYQHGRGRVIVAAWRLGRQYHEAPVVYRRNFEQLLAGLLSYLGDSKAWRNIKPGFPPIPLVGQVSIEDQRRSLELAIRDLIQTHGERYPRGAEYLNRLSTLNRNDKDVAAMLKVLREEALLANPLLDFSKLLLIQRGAKQLGLPMNYLSNSSLPPTGYDNQIAVLSPVKPGGTLTTLYKPAGGQFVGDVDLHFDADRLLFSMPNAKKRWRVHEIDIEGKNLREVPQIQEDDVDNYDACYLPDGGMIFCSTACFTGVPCINGSGHVCNLYRADRSGKIRQLTVEQDHDWCPTVLNSGRLMYLRWEYTDIPHAFSRILFTMNPDGTGQTEHYGSGSYWPASMFYARPVPNHPTKFVAIVGGHHDLPRMGDLVLFDPARGRFEADGAIQRIPGRGKPVAPALLDLPIAQTWPKFLHPWPLSDKYFLVSCQPSPGALWGIYLVDAFDNMVLICEQEGYAMLEPVPLRKTEKPPVLEEKIDPARKDADVLIADIYQGEGLRGVPRGTIKSLRIIGYQFGYQGMGAEPYSVGLDGPWDPKRVLGTVPVCEDGSAHFRVPAYTPIALQPLDADGKAVQLMRSWMTAMPGESVSCVGCHEKQSTSPPARQSIASRRAPDEIRPWYGPARGFDFRREVQPVLDKYCLSCHDGKTASPDFAAGEPVATLKNSFSYNLASRFSPSYYQLRRFVRTPTKEGDLHTLMPWEYHADTTRLVQLLARGHYNVKLDREAWDRLITWIDLNAPFHGTWTDIRGDQIFPQVKHQNDRRRELRKLFTGMEDDYEIISQPASLGAPVIPSPLPARAVPNVRDMAGGVPPTLQANVSVAGWPFDATEAIKRQKATGLQPFRVALGDGVSIEMVPVPAGEFVMGQADGRGDERPRLAKIDRPFWIGKFEITNEQFGRFDPTHDSRFEPGDYIQFSPGERGWPVNRPRQPVVRVSWNQAMAFCRWISAKTAKTFTLPTETQWEHACRAGTATPLSYGGLDTDFSSFANCSDVTHQSIDPFGWPGRAQTLPPWRPADGRFDDHSRVSAPVGSYKPNAWGLFDMHGNVAEWTSSENTMNNSTRFSGSPDAASARLTSFRIARGGSWYDRPDRCRSAVRQLYRPDQPVYDVGFRVICE